MAAVASHTLGSKVWVNDASEGWVKGDVVKVEKGLLKVSTETGTIKAYKPEECPLQNPQTAGGVEVGHTSSYSVELDRDSLHAAVALAFWSAGEHQACCLTLHCALSERGSQLLRKSWCCMPAGHDHPVLPERTRCSLEFESKIPIGRHLHIHWFHPDSCESLCLTAVAIWAAHDGTVQGASLGRAVPPCVRNS